MNPMLLVMMIGMFIPVHLMSSGKEKNIVLYDKLGNFKNPQSIYLQADIAIIPEELPTMSSTTMPEELPTTNSTTLRRRKRGWPVILGGCAVGSGIVAVGHLFDGTWSWKDIGFGCLAGATFGRIPRGKRSPCTQKKNETLSCELVSLGFSQSDRNGNNRLEFSEIIYKNLTGIAAVKFFSSKDTNKNGLLEPNEVHPCLTESTIAEARKIRRCPNIRNRNVPVKKHTVFFK